VGGPRGSAGAAAVDDPDRDDTGVEDEEGEHEIM
jgi:hypothetical protein